MKEINFLSDQFGISGVTFLDCTLNAQSDRFHKLLSELQKTDLLYSAPVRVEQCNSEMIKEMGKAKFINVIVGVETVSKKHVELYHKGGSEYINKAYKAIPELFSEGILPQVNVLICHPYEDYPTVEESLKEWEEFAAFIEEKGIPFYNAPVGTVCINYPSATYFKLLKDPHFKIIYQSVPEELKDVVPPDVKKCIERIPYEAVREDFAEYKEINKVNLCSRIYNLWSKDANKVARCKATAMSQHSDILSKGWINKDVKVVYMGSKSIDVKGDSPVYSVLSMISKKK